MPFLKKNQNLSRIIFTSLTLGFIFLFINPVSTHATCYCTNPIADGCRCTGTGGTFTTTYPRTSIGISCDTPEEANSLESLKNPICGTSTETIPYCSSWHGDPDVIICWKTEFMLGETNAPADTNGHTIAWNNGPIYFNGGTWPGSDADGPHSIVTCSTGPFCCIGGSEGAYRCQDWHPPTPLGCTPQDTGVDPPAICDGTPGVVPGPSGGGTYCEQESNEELHTFRPYPGEPCDRVAHDLAIFCGNTLNLIDSFGITKYYGTEGDYPNLYRDISWNYIFSDTNAPIFPTPFPCPTIAGTQPVQELCTFQINPDGPRVFYFSIDVNDAYFPIMGLTESDYVANRDTRPEDASLDDAQKVNEYVSWYLNGVLSNPSEVVPTPPPEEPYDYYSEKLKNFSGPLRKLLSHRNQRDLTVDEISGIREVRHNQIAGYIVPILGRIVSHWDIPGIVEDWFQYRLSAWEDEEHQPPREEDYNDFIDWLIAYQEWKGRFCIDLGIFHLCFENPFRLNAFSNLFFKVPISSTEDRVGLIQVTGSFFTPQLDTSATDFRIITSIVTTPGGGGFPFANLFFAHMKESVELAEILQNTYASKDPNVELNSSVLRSVQANPWCEIVEVRSNPGDDLDPKDEAVIEGEVRYSSEVDCTFYHVGEGNICSVLGGTCQTNPCGGYVPCVCRHDWGPADCTEGQCLDGCVPVYPQNCQAVASELLDESTAMSYYCYPQDFPDVQCSDTITDSDLPTLIECQTPGFSSPLCQLVLDGVIPPICPSGGVCGYCWQNVSDPAVNSQECRVSTLISLTTDTETPLADEAWSRLVAGEQAVFKKIFPKVQGGAPVESIWDIPASSPVTFESAQLHSVGNPVAGRDVPELYFPHIGGIHQYFLQCTQTALRPLGFGPPCEAGSPGSSPPGGIVVPTPLPSSGPPGPTATPPPGSTPTPTRPPSSGLCQPAPTGSPCDVNNPFFSSTWGNETYNASTICNVESGGWAGAYNYGCLPENNTSLDYSIGLFQINLLVHPFPAFVDPSCPLGQHLCLTELRQDLDNAGFTGMNCPDAFEAPTRPCSVVNQSLLDFCDAWFKDPVHNIRYTKILYDYSRWIHFTSDEYCGIQ